MTRPSFVLAGVPKAGTTSLYHYLQAHPQVFVSRLKEINFLAYPGAEAAARDRPTMWFPITTEAAYDELFAEAGDRVAVDFTIACWDSPVALERIRHHLGDPGVLILLRDPVARAYSAYLHRVRKGYERRPVEEALVPGERTVALGFYADRLERLLAEVGRHRVGIWLTEDLAAEPVTTMSSVLDFLGVADSGADLATGHRHNSASSPRSALLQRLLPDHRTRRRVVHALPDPALRPLRWAWRQTQQASPRLPLALAEQLRAHYAEDVARVEAMLGRDLDVWRVAP